MKLVAVSNLIGGLCALTWSGANRKKKKITVKIKLVQEEKLYSLNLRGARNK